METKPATTPEKRFPLEVGQPNNGPQDTVRRKAGRGKQGSDPHRAIAGLRGNGRLRSDLSEKGLLDVIKTRKGQPGLAQCAAPASLRSELVRFRREHDFPVLCALRDGAGDIRKKDVLMRAFRAVEIELAINNREEGGIDIDLLAL